MLWRTRWEWVLVSNICVNFKQKTNLWLLLYLQLFSGLDASDAYVVVLNTLPTSRFTSEVPSSELPVPIMRALKTNKFAGTPLCPILEQPNLVSGLAAQGQYFFKCKFWSIYISTYMFICDPTYSLGTCSTCLVYISLNASFHLSTYLLICLYVTQLIL